MSEHEDNHSPHNEDVLSEMKQAYMLASIRTEYVTGAETPDDLEQRLATVVGMHGESLGAMVCVNEDVVRFAAEILYQQLRQRFEEIVPHNKEQNTEHSAVFWSGYILGRAMEERNAHLLLKDDKLSPARTVVEEN